MGMNAGIFRYNLLMKTLEAFKDTKRLIVVAAHPDDLETQIGGTIALLVQQGITVFSVNCTLGDIGTNNPAYHRQSLATARLAETKAADRILGIEQSYNLGHPDGELVPSLPLRAQIARLYRLTQADTLVTFDPYWTGQIHPDHRAAGQAALDAYMPAKMPLYHPEQLNEKGAGLGCLTKVFLFNSGEPDVFVEVSDVYETKMAACVAHKSQFPQGEADLEWMKGLDKGRAERVNAGIFVESFKQMPVW
jgi:LmbE family N-acetylglucosaminyl deacetylase